MFNFFRKILLRYDFNHFQLKHTAEILCDFWNFKYYHTNRCNACHIYSTYFKAILSERWNKNWGDFETIITSIENHDQKYLCLMYQKNRWEIFDKLIELNK